MQILLVTLGIIFTLVIYAFISAYITKKISERKKEFEEKCIEISKLLKSELENNDLHYRVITSYFKKNLLHQVFSVTHKNIRGYRNIEFNISSPTEIEIKIGGENFSITNPEEFPDILGKFNLIENEQ